MSESYHVVCPNCTAVNRLPREKKASAGKSDPDMESLMIDSTVVRAHACAAGAKGG